MARRNLAIATGKSVASIAPAACLYRREDSGVSVHKDGDGPKLMRAESRSTPGGNALNEPVFSTALKAALSVVFCPDERTTARCEMAPNPSRSNATVQARSRSGRDH